MPFQRIGVVGAGAWGTALAQTVAAAGREVTLWARDPALAATIAATGENPAYLPGVALSPTIRAAADAQALDTADMLLLATPAQHLRAICRILPPTAAPLVVCAKGFEAATGLMPAEVAAAERPAAPVAVLSGPSFAAEVARGQPTAVTLAAADSGLGASLVEALGSRTFRPYWSADMAGVQIGGAVKNVLAIAAGIVMGRGLGENARAALITRGLAEMMRLGAALGAQPQTLTGLSGLGDLILTATSLASRNTSLGYALGQGRALTEIMAERRAVTEGVPTAAAAVALGARHGVELPVAGAVDAILNQGAAIDEVVTALLARPFRPER